MNEKYVINIGRQYGAGGLEIAEKLSKKLGINYYDKKLIDIAAQKSGLGKEFFEQSDEKDPIGILGDLTGWFSDIFGAMHGAGDNLLLNNSLFKIQSDIIKQLARKESCIFVGRCADYVLRENPRCVNIFICSDTDERVRKIAQRDKDTRDNIRKKIELTDRRRAKYYNFYSNKLWGAAQSYHLCVDSSVLGADETADFICSFAVKKLGFKNCSEG